MAQFRTDIQALRAVAVLLVLAFHVWPAAVPGGYIGVDVFFVISGYLITGHLVREVAGTGRVDLAGFYARRARRLLPAASLTLAVVGVVAYVWMPASYWQVVATDMAASAFYAENWVLVHRSVDYLAQNQAPSPLQHFWSLAVEEQFYLVWPLVIAALAAGWRRWKARPVGSGLDPEAAAAAVVVAGLPRDAHAAPAPPRAVYALPVAALCTASLAVAMHCARTDPAPAYFTSHTRLYELGMGGLLGVWTSARSFPATGAAGRGGGTPSFGTAARDDEPSRAGLLKWVRTLAAAGGLVAIGGSACLFTTGLPFPGAVALVPTLGAAAFILAGEGRPGNKEAGASPPAVHALSRLLAHTWLQYVGAISYSLYLAHWPVVVVFPYVTGRPVDGVLADGVTVLVVSWALAHACKVGWEDRFRHGPALPPPPPPPPPRNYQQGATLPSHSVVTAADKLAGGGAGGGGGGAQSTAQSRSATTSSWQGSAGLVLALTVAIMTVSAGLYVQGGRVTAALAAGLTGGGGGGGGGGASATSAAGAANVGRQTAHPGAEAMVKDAARPAAAYPTLPLDHVLPPIDVAAMDLGPGYSDSPGAKGGRCHTGHAGADVRLCTYRPDSGAGDGDGDGDGADTNATPHIVLIGDSHAAHWLPALYEVARKRGWAATGLSKSSCLPFNVTVQTLMGDKLGRPYTECREWAAKVLAWVHAARPAVVLVSTSHSYRASEAKTRQESDAALAGAVRAAMRGLSAAGIPVVILRHTPSQRNDVPSCLAAARTRGLDVNASNEECSSPAEAGLPKASFFAAAAAVPGVHVLDFADAFVDGAGTCPAIVGNVVVYRDKHHMTAAYARTLAPALERRLVAAVPGLAE